MTSFLTDDMVFAGPVPQPVGKKESVGLMTAMVAGIPNWKFNATDFRQNGNQVMVTFQFSGTQTGELKSAHARVPKNPPTGKHVSLPKEPSVFTLKDNKISRLEASAVPAAG